MVKYFIEELNINVNVSGEKYASPLHFAAQNGQLNIVKHLIDTHQCDLLIRDEYNNTPLHYGALHGQLQVVKYFIEELNVDANITGQEKYTPLQYATENNQPAVVKYLIDHHHCAALVRDEGNNKPTLRSRLKSMDFGMKELSDTSIYSMESFEKEYNDWELQGDEYFTCNLGMDVNITELHNDNIPSIQSAIESFENEYHEKELRVDGYFMYNDTFHHCTVQNDYFDIANNLINSPHFDPVVGNEYKNEWDMNRTLTTFTM